MSNPLNETINKYVLDKILKASLKPDFFPNKNTETYKNTTEDFSRFCQAVLTDSLHTPETIESMIWTITNYCYKELGIDSRFHIASHMRHGARGESSLYMMKEFYRDHFFHTIEVCFLGHLLIHTSNNKGKTILNQNLLKDWYITALLHDMGYAVDITNGLTDWLDFFTSTTFEELYKNIKSAIKKNSEQDDFKEFYSKYDFLAENKPWEDHGIVGAHHLQSLYDELNKKLKIKSIECAIKAIAKHNCHDIKVNYETEPLTALLILCDTIQIWGRPQFLHFSLGPAWIMSLMYSTTNSYEMPQPVSASLFSNVKFDNVNPFFKNTLILRLEFSESVNYNSMVFNIWLDILSNMQRIDFGKLPFNILLQIKTPTYFSSGAKNPKTQLSRLIDAATDTHMAYLSNFFKLTSNEKFNIPDVEHGNHSCCLGKTICYHTENKDGKYSNEMLSFNLQKFDGQKQYMTQSLSRFRSDYKNWKLYNEDRLFEGDYSPWNHKKK